MIRAITPIALITLVLSSAAPEAEHDEYASPLADLRRERSMIISHAPIGAHDIAPRKQRSPRQINEANYRIAIRAGERVGVPARVMVFHLDKESGGRADARNPRSTATGLGQPIRCTHAVIIGRDCRSFTLGEHIRLAVDPEHNARVTAAHIRACMDLMPGASAHDLWRRCHVAGHGNVGGRVQMARAYFQPDAQGWLSRGSVAVAWARDGGGA